jgi:hypothetical protein
VTDNDVKVALPDREISLHPVAGGAVLFDPWDRKLYALNPAAGLTWLCIRDGLSRTESGNALADGLGVDPELAASWFDDCVDMFRNLELLGDRARPRPTAANAAKIAPITPPDVSGTTQRFRLFDRSIAVHAPAGLQSGVSGLLGTLRIDASQAADCLSEIFISVTPAGHDDWQISVDGEVEADCATESVVAELERVVVQTVVPATPHILTLHAAALQGNGRTLLLAAPSGSGKTTLSVALCHAGWQFGSDELVLIERKLGLRPLPLPPCIKSETFEVVETWFPTLAACAPHRRYGRTIKYLPISPRNFERASDIVIFPRFQVGGGNTLEGVDSFDGLQKLLAQCVFVSEKFDHGDVAELQRWHEGLRYFNLEYDSCDAAVELLRTIA